MPVTIPLLAICIPTYNRSHSLEKCLQSVCLEISGHQLEDDVIIIISDNDSSDNTREVVRTFIDSNKVTIRYTKNEVNIGAVNNFIHLVEIATAVNTFILGDDDEVVPGSLPKVLSILKNNPEILVHHFKCKQTSFIELGMSPLKLTAGEAAEKYFYNLGNAGTFIFNTEKAKTIVAAKKERLAGTCWPQTEIMFLMLVASKEDKKFLVAGVELVSSDSHDDNVIYNTWYIVETFCFSLLRVAQNVDTDYPGTGIMAAAKKSIPGCYQAVKYFFRFILFATYYDYGYELEKTKSLIRENKQYLKGSNAFYPRMYSLLIDLPRWVKKLLTAFYFFVSKPSFKKTTFDKHYETIKSYQQKKLAVYTQKGKLTEDTERYIY